MNYSRDASRSPRRFPVRGSNAVGELFQALKLPPTEFKDKFDFEKPQKDQAIVFYCRSGKRSTIASQIADGLKYTQVYNYAGSWLDWTSK
jgi:rhodanese-related sulfurtransferase